MNFYGFFIVLGILVGVLVVEKINKKWSMVNGQWSMVDVLPYILIPGIIGARLYHVIDYWQYYGENLVDILMVWKGGLGIFGAVIGGMIGIWIFLKLKTKNKKPKTQTKDTKIGDIFLSYLDLGVVGLSIGQAIGRWGNYFNQELYGLPTSLPWGIYIRLENRLPGFENFTHFHPLFLYESIGCFAIFLILIKKTPILKIKYQISKTHIKNKKTPKRGSIFFQYLFLYSLMRFWLEFLRIDSWKWGFLGAAQWISLGLMLISGLAICKKNVKISGKLSR